LEKKPVSFSNPWKTGHGLFQSLETARRITGSSAAYGNIPEFTKSGMLVVWWVRGVEVEGEFQTPRVWAR
jgi:hypothetical protein